MQRKIKWYKIQIIELGRTIIFLIRNAVQLGLSNAAFADKLSCIVSTIEYLLSRQLCVCFASVIFVKFSIWTDCLYYSIRNSPFY